MDSTAPHFLLFTQANRQPSGGHWKFVLERIGSDYRIVESDIEPDVTGERLQLLAAIRGLESLEQPSRVTLVTSSTYVGRGIRSGLKLWSNQNWQVEVDGELKPHLGPIRARSRGCNSFRELVSAANPRLSSQSNPH